MIPGMQNTPAAGAIRADPEISPDFSAEHALHLVEQAAAKGGEVGCLTGEEGIDHALVFPGQLRFDEFRDRLEGPVDLFGAEPEGGEPFFEFVHGFECLVPGTGLEPVRLLLVFKWLDMEIRC